jgi:hypothetical protein
VVSSHLSWDDMQARTRFSSSSASTAPAVPRAPPRHHQLPLPTTVVVSSEYFTPTNRNLRRPYAHPAYDEYDTGSGPFDLNDGDLLAPALLNAAPTVRAFYSLQRVRLDLIKALEQIPVSLTLADTVANQTMPQLLGDLVAVLDGPERPAGVRLTTLLKVLHRKRPEFIPLYDQFVGACYYGGANPFPVRPTPGRLVSGYAVAVATAINDDLQSQQSVFDELHDLAPQVSRLRLLDVLAWKVGRRSPADDAADMSN